MDPSPASRYHNMPRQPNLCDMPGEIQDHVILSLHPSAIVALSQTSHHFRQIARLVRLGRETIDEFLVERKLDILRAEDYLCGSCYALRPPNKFTSGHLKGKYGKNGQSANKRCCVDCMLAKGSLLPGNVVDMAGKRSVYCFVCLSLQDYFCIRCHWCHGCAQKRQRMTYRKSWEKEYGSPDGMTMVCNRCQEHTFTHPVD